MSVSHFVILHIHWLKACHVMSFGSCIQLNSISWNKLQIVTCCILVCRRPGSDFKRREMHGSGIFNGSGSGQSDGNGAHADRTTVRMHQVIIALCMSPFLVIKIYLVLKCKGILITVSYSIISITRQRLDLKIVQSLCFFFGCHFFPHLCYCMCSSLSST